MILQYFDKKYSKGPFCVTRLKWQWCLSLKVLTDKILLGLIAMDCRQILFHSFMSVVHIRVPRTRPFKTLILHTKPWTSHQVSWKTFELLHNNVPSVLNCDVILKISEKCVMSLVWLSIRFRKTRKLSIINWLSMHPNYIPVTDSSGSKISQLLFIFVSPAKHSGT